MLLDSGSLRSLLLRSFTLLLLFRRLFRSHFLRLGCCLRLSLDLSCSLHGLLCRLLLGLEGLLGELCLSALLLLLPRGCLFLFLALLQELLLLLK